MTATASSDPNHSPIYLLNFAYNLSPADEALLAARFITPDLARQAGLRRVDSYLGSAVINREPRSGYDYSGLVIPYLRPGKPLTSPRAYRLRRDHPDLEYKADGSLREVAKYLGAPGQKNLLYFPVGLSARLLTPPHLPLLFVEGEFKAMAAWRLACDLSADGSLPFLPLALQGCWNWRATTTDASGRRIKEVAADLYDLALEGRRVILFRDSNVFTNESVAVGWRRFAAYLEHERGAEVFECEAPSEPNLNGLDDLAARYGPSSVLARIEQARRREGYRPPQKASREEREGRARALRQAMTAQEQATAVIGAKAVKAMARLWAECELSAESRDLLCTLEAMAGGEEEAEFRYAELYPLLYRAAGAFEMTVRGSRTLTRAARKRLRERFEKLRSDQQRCQITFAYLTEGGLDKDDNPVNSSVRLFSRAYIAEIEARAEQDPGYTRHREASRAQATTALVREKAGAAYLEPKAKKISANKKIANGMGRTKGNFTATVRWMHQRGDREEQIWRAMCECLPEGLIDFIERGGAKALREARKEADESPKSAKRVPLKRGVSSPESTDHYAQNSDFV